MWFAVAIAGLACVTAALAAYVARTATRDAERALSKCEFLRTEIVRLEIIVKEGHGGG